MRSEPAGLTCKASQRTTAHLLAAAAGIKLASGVTARLASGDTGPCPIELIS